MATEQQPSDKMLTNEELDAEVDVMDLTTIRSEIYSGRVHFSAIAPKGFLDDSDHLLKSDPNSPSGTSRHFYVHVPTLPTPTVGAQGWAQSLHGVIREEAQAKKPANGSAPRECPNRVVTLQPITGNPRKGIESCHGLFQSAQMDSLEFNRARPTTRRIRRPLPFTELPIWDGESFFATARPHRGLASGALAPRGMSKLIKHSRSARLLKTSILPEHMKTFTRKEFREAPKITDELAADD
ncbi:hypothetical protein niasHT_008378 [Heterodera trifolii]|uniref:Uncharacterized protein n=1 Tax=Heterodera trifolii TaxID=157864 RepID=A0ABD2LVN5_9BILA